MAPTTLFATALLAVAGGAQTQSLRPKTPNFPSPWVSGGPGWDDAYAKAKAFVSQLTLVEKVNLTSGVGWESDRCVGNTGSVPRLGFAAFCLEDGPVGVRYSKASSPRNRPAIPPPPFLPTRPYSHAEQEERMGEGHKEKRR